MEKVSAMLKGGGGRGWGTTSFGLVLTWELEVLAILCKGGAQSFHPFKRREQKILPCLVGGVQKVSYPDFPILWPPSP